MALEPDTVEVDPATGKPAVHDFAYRVVYRWTSHYVHPTIGALDNHIVQAGHDNFVVRSGHAKDMRNMAVFTLQHTVQHNGASIAAWAIRNRRVRHLGGALVAHLAHRHK